MVFVSFSYLVFWRPDVCYCWFLTGQLARPRSKATRATRAPKSFYLSLFSLIIFLVFAFLHGFKWPLTRPEPRPVSPQISVMTSRCPRNVVTPSKWIKKKAKNLWPDYGESRDKRRKGNMGDTGRPSGHGPRMTLVITVLLCTLSTGKY